MKNIKDIALLAFAVIGFYTIITAFTTTESNQPQQVYATPESHVFEASGITPNGAVYIYNKRTGEAYYMLKGDKRYGK
jgi:hypothetical protein